jgi:endonuclease-3 related protein
MNGEHGDYALLHETLLRAYGPQGWWPGKSRPFEVIAGAILTQRTTWANAERALAALRKQDLLRPEAIRAAEEGLLQDLVRPAGFARAKAATIRAFCAMLWMKCGGDLAALLARPLDVLRPNLLSVRGIGDETADAILVYAAGLPSFVIDAYTRRLLARLGWIVGNERYASLQRTFSDALPHDASVFGEAHALLVHHGKTRCRARPDCQTCPLSDACATNKHSEVSR